MKTSSTTSVTAALIAAAATIIVAIVSWFLKRKSDHELEDFKIKGNTAIEDFKGDRQEALQKLQSRLAELQAEHGAQLNYEYEARKHLYAEFYPLLFQLVEACESAYNRISGIAIAAREQLLGGFLEDGGYRFSTVYRLMSPLAVFRLCQWKITSVDLSVDVWVKEQYLTAKQLYGGWVSSDELAQAQPSIRYQPFPPQNKLLQGSEAEHARQHLSVADIEQLIESLQVRDADQRSRSRSYGEFISWSSKDGQNSPLSYSIESAMALFDGFHPSARPMLWRILLAEAVLCRLLIRSFQASIASGYRDNGSLRSSVPPKLPLVTEQERRELDWAGPNAPEEHRAQVSNSFLAVTNYLTECFSPYGLYGTETRNSEEAGRVREDSLAPPHPGNRTA